MGDTINDVMYVALRGDGYDDVLTAMWSVWMLDNDINGWDQYVDHIFANTTEGKSLSDAEYEYWSNYGGVVPPTPIALLLETGDQLLLETGDRLLLESGDEAAKISDLTELETLADDVVFPVVDDPSGTPVTKQATVGTLVDYIVDGLGLSGFMLMTDDGEGLTDESGDPLELDT